MTSEPPMSISLPLNLERKREDPHLLAGKTYYMTATKGENECARAIYDTDAVFAHARLGTLTLAT